MAASNQSQIPVLQHPDGVITQLQQNTNKGLKNFSNQTTAATNAIQSMTIVGEVKQAALSESQFQSVAGTNWLFCNGQSCVNTNYSRLTGNSFVPTITPAAGVNSFILVN